jgi:ADP-ribose pyrophosphatase YjhB (NUDIX family)
VIPGEGADAPKAGYFAVPAGGIVTPMTHLQASLARQTAEERIRQAEQRRLVRDLQPTETRRRTRRYLLDALFA